MEAPAIPKRKHVDCNDTTQSPAVKRMRTDISYERQLTTPLDAGIGTGRRVFNGSLVRVEKHMRYRETFTTPTVQTANAVSASDMKSIEECTFLNFQTMTDMRNWSLDELRLQEYYHGYRYRKPVGVPQSSNKRTFNCFGGNSGEAIAVDVSGPAAAKRKLDGGASAGMTKCIICLDRMDKYDSVTIKCGLTYCRDCIHLLFSRSLSDPELFPPRCCKEAIPYEQVLVLFPGHFNRRFDDRLEEFYTANPIYCPTVNSGQFLAPRINY